MVNEEVIIHEKEVPEGFLDEKLMVVKIEKEKFPWFATMANFKAIGEPPKDLKLVEKKNFF